MSTNATTWFYHEPETGRPYLISERLTHTFWANRLSDVYLTCVQAESPYRVTGEWRDMTIDMEWEPNQWFKLYSDTENAQLIKVCQYVLGFRPSLSYYDENGRYITEWHTDKQKGQTRLNELQGSPAYRAVSNKYSKK